MTVQRARVAAPNSLVLIWGSAEVDVPETLDGALVAATPSCIAVGTRSEADGETIIELSAGRDSDLIAGYDPQAREHLLPAFDGELSTPSGDVSVGDITGETYLSIPVGGESVRIRIWTNDASEPDLIWIEARSREA
jgi:hypothetical protein